MPTATLTSRLTAAGDPAERQVRAFFCFHDDDCLPDGEDVSIPISRVGLLVDALVHDRDFFGFLDEADRVLQVRYDSEHGSWVELPSVTERGSHGRGMSHAELRTFVSALPRAFTRDALPGATFTAW